MKRYKRALDINLVHLKELSAAGQIKHYAFFLLFKSKYANSCIYNFTQVGLASKFGVSRAAIRKHIKFFLDNGWCEMHSGNLIFKKLWSFDLNKSKVIYNIDIKDQVSQVLKDLYLLMLRHKQASFNRLKQLGCDINYPRNSRSYRKALAAVKRMKVDRTKLPTANDQLKISLKAISTMFGCSVAKTHNILTVFKKTGEILCIEAQRKAIAYSKVKGQLKSWLASEGCYIYKGIVFQKQCNSYIFA